MTERVAELSNQLNQINEAIEAAQNKIDSEGKKKTDSTPLQAIKEALRFLKSESKEMELRSAVLSHSVFQAKLKEKSKGYM